MEKDRVIPLFIAVCLFYVSGKLLSLLIRSGPWPYVIAAVASLVLGYVLYDDRMKNWLKKPDCSGKDSGLSLLVSAVVFVIIGKLLLWMFEVIPQLIWGNDLPGFFYNWVASFMTLIFRRHSAARHLLHNRRQAVFPPPEALAGELNKEREAPLLIFLPFCRRRGP